MSSEEERKKSIGNQDAILQNIENNLNKTSVHQRNPFLSMHQRQEISLVNHVWKSDVSMRDANIEVSPNGSEQSNF
jgi:hypothetical protein